MRPPTNALLRSYRRSLWERNGHVPQFILAKAIFIAIVCFSSVAYGLDSSILGEWRADNRSKGGIGTTLVFGADGKFYSYLGALLDFTYEMKNRELILFPNDPMEH